GGGSSPRHIRWRRRSRWRRPRGRRGTPRAPRASGCRCASSRSVKVSPAPAARRSSPGRSAPSPRRSPDRAPARRARPTSRTPAGSPCGESRGTQINGQAGAWSPTAELSTVTGPASAFPRRNRADGVHLAELDAVVAEDRVRHRRMEEEVRDRDVDEVVVAPEPPAAEPGRGHLPLFGAGQVLRLDALEEAEALLDPLPQLRERLLGVRVGRRLLAAEVRGRVLRLVARGLHL